MFKGWIEDGQGNKLQGLKDEYVAGTRYLLLREHLMGMAEQMLAMNCAQVCVVMIHAPDMDKPDIAAVVINPERVRTLVV